MGDFFKELLNSVLKVWKSLSLGQRILVSSVAILTFIALIAIIVIPKSVSPQEQYSLLYKNLSADDLSAISEKLDQNKIKYKLGDNGSISVLSNDIYSTKMMLAKDGLPANKSHIGYEIFDKQSFGVTNFQQKVNYKRALEGELTKTINSINEVENCRVHIVEEKESVFEEQKEPAKASVTLKLKPGKRLNSKQVQAIVYLVANSVDGLDKKNITIITSNGEMLTNPYLENDMANLTSYQQNLTLNAEKLLEKKVQSMLYSVLGEGKSTVRVSLELNFQKMEQTKEEYNPDGGVVRSKQDDNVSGQSATDKSTKTKSSKIVNYEIDKSVSHIIGEVGNIKRMTVSVAIDGKYTKDKDGKVVYEPRKSDEIAQIEALVKNAVGLNTERGDEIFVTNVQFDKTFISNDLQDISKKEKVQTYSKYLKWGLFLLIVIILILMFKALVRFIIGYITVSEPEYPEVAEASIESDEDKDVKKTTEMINSIEGYVETDLDVLIVAIKAMMKETKT